MSEKIPSQELSPTKQALLALKEMQAKVASLENARNEPIAVISMACRFPGNADSPEALWELLKNGGDGIVEVPQERWDAEMFYDPDPEVSGKMYTKHGGFLSDIDRFDPAFFGISPREADSLDPHQRLLLQVSWEALENGGLDPNALYGSRTGVYVGISNFEYGAQILWPEDPANITAYSGTGGSLGVTAGRLSYTFGFTGPSMIIDTACSSSLVSTHLAMQALRLGECDLALSAGVNLIFGPQTHINFCKARMLAPDGHCKTFSEDADGYARGEGVGVLLLKRLSDAERDGDTILAVLRGSAVNQDGPSGGLTVPNGPSQVNVIRAALENARVSPDEVGYIEAHGTGTPLGDPIEIGALATVFGKGRQQRKNPLRVASVKTNIGHLESAAGVAGLIKSILAVHHGRIPPHCNFKAPNPNIDWKALDLEIPDKLTTWDDEVRLAGVSSFSFSGTNSHIILSNYRTALQQPSENGEVPQLPEGRLLVLSSRTDPNLKALSKRVRQDLENLPAAQWEDYCESAACGRGHFNYRMAIAASSPDEAAGMLVSGQGITGKRSTVPRRIAFVFTGQGAQYINMGRQLYEREPYFRSVIDQCEKAVGQLNGRSLTELLYPDSSVDTAAALIDQTEYTQPLLFAVEYALARLWMKWGIEPEALIGHSLGELTAAAVSGLISLEDGLALVTARGRLMAEKCSKGAMAAVGMSEKDVNNLLREHTWASELTIASVNGPNSTVVAGSGEAIDRFVTELTQTDTEVKKLRVSHAFHSSLVEPMIEPFRKVVSAVTFGKSTIPLVSNVSGEISAAGEMADAGYWCEHIRRPVRFFDGISRLIDDGYNTFIEIGPKPTLSALGQSIAEEHEHGGDCRWLPSMRFNTEPWSQLLQSLGNLYLLGVDEAAAALVGKSPNNPVKRYPLKLPNTPFISDRYWFSHDSRTRKPGRSFGGRPLLGGRLSTPLLQADSTLFVNEITLNDASFLAHHQIFGKVVLPAAAHLEMALSAAEETLPDQPIVRDVVIQRPLVLSPEQTLPVQTVLHPSANGSRFEIYSRSPGTDNWQSHTTGELSSAPPSRPKKFDLSGLKKRCIEPVETDDYYRRAASVGIEHGEDFQALKELWQGDGELLGRLELPSGIGGNPGLFSLHPVLVDAAFQMASYPLIDSGTPYLPVGLDQLKKYSQLPRKLWCYVSYTLPKEGDDRRIFETDLHLIDDKGEIIAEVAGLRFQRVDRRQLTAADSRYDDWFYGIEWQKKPVFGRASLLLQKPDGIGKSLSEQTTEAADACAFYTSLFADMDRLASHFVLKEFLLGGWNPEMGEAVTTAELVLKLGVSKSFIPLFERCLDMLREDGILRQEGDSWTVLEKFKVLPDKAVEELRRKHEEADPEMTLFFRCAEALGPVWRDETDPLSLLFPDADLSVTTLLYKHSTGARSINNLLADAVTEALVKLPQSQGIRILEVGGGTGGTTAHLLPRLPADRCDYLFTDISAHFTRQAEKQFGTDYPFLRYSTLDIEKEPPAEMQGSFDLVIAANVVHATRNLGETLDHCRALLAPGGIMVLLEASAKQRWLDMTFGMTEGWWRFSGHDTLRSDYPLLSPSQWEEILSGHGFESVTLLGPDQISDEPGLQQNIILARNSEDPRILQDSVPVDADEGHWLLIGEENASTDELQRKLTGRVTLVKTSRILDPSADTETLKEILEQPLKGIVMLHALDETDPVASAEELIAHQKVLSMPLLRLARAISTVDSAVSPRLWIVTRDAIAFGNRAEGISQSILHGLARTLRSEYPDLKPVVIDLTGEVETVLTDWILDELLSADTEDQVVIREDTRWVNRLVRRTKDLPAEVELHSDASYLNTGGLGDLGLKIAHYLVSNGARHLIMMSRSQPGPKAIEALAELEKMGAVIEIAHVDVTDYRAVDELVKKPGRPPLRGVIHAAGTLNDGVLSKMDWTQFESVLKAKVMGGWNLHHATEGLELDYFILFSSIGSLFGPAGQGNYAAANAYLDQLAGYRIQAGLPALSINWGAWSEIGLAARQNSASQVGAMKGILPILPDEGIAAFDRIWKHRGQFAVVPVNWPVLFEYLPELSLIQPFRSEIKENIMNEETQTNQLETLQKMPAEEREELLVRLVSEKVAQVLGSDAATLDITAGFFDLGMDSLTAVEMRNALQTSLGMELPSTLIFKYPNITAVAGYLVGELNKADGRSQDTGDKKPDDRTLHAAESFEEDVTEMSEDELNALIDDEFNNLMGD